MRRASLIACVLPVWFLVAPPARAGDKTADMPTVVVRVKSLDVLLQNVNLVVKLVGQDQIANQLEGLIKSKIGKKGLEGMDTSRPFGAYVRFGKSVDDVSGAILVPMIDDKTFLNWLGDVGIEYKKDKDGIYTHKTDKNVDLFFRFAHKYLYITGVNAESIQDKNLPDPAKALAITGDAAVSVIARVEQVPDAAKLVVLAELQKAIEAAQKKSEPGETKVQEAFRVALLGDFHKFASSLVRDASEVRFDLDVSDKAKELDVSFNVTPKPQSDLAKTIKTIGDLKSPLAGLVKENAAFHGAVHLALPDALSKAFSKLIEEVRDNALKGIQDPAKKTQAKTLLDALMPTAKSGEFQAVAAVIGPKDSRYTLIGAVKLKDGDKLGKTVHELLKEALLSIPEDQKGKYQLAFDSVGPIKIHKFELPKDPNLDKLIADVAGDNQLYVAFRDDALFLALGKDSLATLKSALAKTDSAKSPPLLFDFDVARMANLMAQTDDQKALAARLFAKGDAGRVRLSIDGGTSLQAHLQMKLNVLEFLMKLKNEKEQ